MFFVGNDYLRDYYLISNVISLYVIFKKILFNGNDICSYCKFGYWEV